MVRRKQVTRSKHRRANAPMMSADDTRVIYRAALKRER